MEKVIDKLIEEYKKEKAINVYIVGREGSGKSILSHQILEKICERLNIKPTIEMIDVINNISKVEGINLIETHINSQEYKYKIEVFMKYVNGELKRGFFKFHQNKEKEIYKFNNKDIFKNEYYKKKLKILDSYLFN